MKKNLVLMIMSGSIIIALVVFYLLVFSYYQAISENRARLKNYQDELNKITSKKEDVVSDKWIKQYEERHKELNKEIPDCKNYYIEIDKALERWFPRLNITTVAPSREDFKPIYQSEKNNLIKQLKDKKIYGVSEGESEISVTK
ncbi:MAG: hypothetical protein QME16_04545, partial [Planctomycetota bacterium]|nr:hypothetical protein [Planctomycetota bacterium]